MKNLLRLLAFVAFTATAALAADAKLIAASAPPTTNAPPPPKPATARASKPATPTNSTTRTQRQGGQQGLADRRHRQWREHLRAHRIQGSQLCADRARHRAHEGPGNFHDATKASAVQRSSTISTTSPSGGGKGKALSRLAVLQEPAGRREEITDRKAARPAKPTPQGTPAEARARRTHRC